MAPISCLVLLMRGAQNWLLEISPLITHYASKATHPMVEITVRYEGQLRCIATHGPSGSVIQTDAPIDNHGKGEAFSPTDLLAAALPACIMTIMGIVSERHGLNLAGMTAVTQKEMTTEGIRRIKSLRTVLTVPLPAGHPQCEPLERAAHTCPVHKSLAAEIDAPIQFVWAG